MTLEFSGGEKSLYDCAIQLDPSALNFSETHLYVTQTRLVFELERPLSVELSEIMEIKLENMLGERVISLRYKDLSGVNSIKFVCTGFGGIISNISKTIFVSKLINKLREGMHPRDVRLMMSSSTAELYAPWLLLTALLVIPTIAILFPLDYTARMIAGIILLATFIGFSSTEVYKLLLGRLRLPVCGIVCTIIIASLIVIWNNYNTVEVMQPATIIGKEIIGDPDTSTNGWYCTKIRTDKGEERLCITHEDWKNYNVGDKITVYYLQGPIQSTLISYRYEDRTQEYVIKNRA